MIKRTAVLGGMVFALALPVAPVAAQYGSNTNPPPSGTTDSGNPSAEVGGGPPVQILGNEAAPAPSPAPAPVATEAVESAPGGTLPFTGTDVVALGAFAAGLIAVGAVLVRRGRRATLQS